MSYLNQVTISNTSNASITPLQDESLVLLRRLAKTLSCLGVKDSNGRQRVVCDSIFNNLTIAADADPTVFPIGQSVTNVNCPSVNNGTQPAPSFGNGAANFYTNVWEGPVDMRWRYINSARITYSNAIRSNLN